MVSGSTILGQSLKVREETSRAGPLIKRDRSLESKVPMIRAPLKAAACNKVHKRLWPMVELLARKRERNKALITSIKLGAAMVVGIDFPTGTIKVTWPTQAGCPPFEGMVLNNSWGGFDIYSIKL